MLILDDARSLYQRRNELSYPQYLRELLKHIHELQYQDGTFIYEFCQNLSQQLHHHAKQSPAYESDKIRDRTDLQDKEKWYLKGWTSAASNTSGSTTGQRFHYLRWADIYIPIESEIHYRAILKEYNLDRPINILYFMLDQFEDRNTDNLIRNYTTSNALISHGMRQNAHIHEVIRNRNYFNNYFQFYENLITYLSSIEIDVILAPGSLITELTNNIKRLHHTAPICKLLSSTGTKTNLKDVTYLKDNGIIGNWCDHMRCWDGGVTFFTCPYHTNHLLDGLSWAWSDEGRLVSNDFYSLPSPFYKYWNGDYASIGTEFKRCKCGRSYREFKFDRLRTYAVNGMTNKDIRIAMDPLSDIFPNITRINHWNNFIRFFTPAPLHTEHRERIRKVLPTFEINFVTE